MKTIGLIAMSLIMFGCSSSPFKESTKRSDMIADHMAKGKRYVGGDFDSRFNSSGSDGFTVKSIGKSLYPVNQNEELAKAAAIADAKFKLIQSAPSEFKTVVQKAVGNSLGFTGEFNQIDMSLTEVHGLKGVIVKEEDVECKVVTSPNIQGDYDHLRECRAISQVPLSELNKAYDFTLEKKYGSIGKSSVEKILNEHLHKQAMNN